MATDLDTMTLAPFKLMRVMLSSFEKGDQFVYLPICSVCGEPILDFSGARLVPRMKAETEPTPARPNRDSLVLLEENSAVHSQCDPLDRNPWIPLRYVFRIDQSWMQSLGEE